MFKTFALLKSSESVRNLQQKKHTTLPTST